VKTIEELLTEEKYLDYVDLYTSSDLEVVLKTDAGDYQGDSFLLLKDSVGRYGYAEFGWGSCSGCDSLQACSSPKEYEELRQQLVGGIVWRDTADEMLDFFYTRDWEVQWSSNKEEHEGFRKEVVEYLSRRAL
jgi:hypothetical protein